MLVSVFGPCFLIQYWLLNFNCLSDNLCQLVFVGIPRGAMCWSNSFVLWYFLVILTYILDLKNYGYSNTNIGSNICIYDGLGGV